MDEDETARTEEQALRATIPAEWVAKPVPPVQLSRFDRSAKLVDLGSPNAVRGNKGFRSVRATAGVCEGDWYYEAEILAVQGAPSPTAGAVRPGWTTRRSDVETPAGFDLYGFSIRDRTGEFVHCARRRAYGRPFKAGDVVGCRIQLPELTADEREAVRKADHAWLTFRFVNLLQGQSPADSGIDITARASVTFYLNGDCLGVPAMFDAGKRAAAEKAAAPAPATTPSPTSKASANTARVAGLSPGAQQDGKSSANGKSSAKQSGKTRPPRDGVGSMRAGLYYPTLSLYGESRARANFGPDFAFEPPAGTRPMCEAVASDAQQDDAVEVGDAAMRPDVPNMPTVPHANGGMDAGAAARDGAGLSEVARHEPRTYPPAMPVPDYHNLAIPAAATAAASEALVMPPTTSDEPF